MFYFFKEFSQRDQCDRIGSAQCAPNYNLGFLLKNIYREELLGAIRSVAAGQTCIKQSFFNKALQYINDGADRAGSFETIETADGEPTFFNDLTPLEQDVLQLLVEGMTY